MGLFKSIFGGKDNSAQKGQAAQNEAAREFIERQSGQARRDALNLFPSSEENRNLGIQAALDVLGGTIPQQLQSAQSGNVAAQEAILGIRPQTTRINADTSFARQTLPDFTSIADALSGTDIGTQNLLSGINTDADLFHAASQGSIPGIGIQDQKFFARLAAENPGFLDSTRFVDDPIGQIPSFLGVPEGLDVKNERRLQNLLRQFQGLR